MKHDPASSYPDKVVVFLLLVVAAFFVSLDVNAAEKARPVAEVVSMSQMASLLSGLLIVLLVFFAMAFLLKKLSGIKGLSKGYMEVVDAMHLGSKERLLIVRVTDNYLLVSVSAQGIQRLDALNAENFALDDKPNSPRPGFAQLLARSRTSNV